MFRPSGSSARTVTLAPSARKIAGGLERRAVRAVEQDADAAQVKAAEAQVERAEVAVEGAVDLAHAAERGRRAGGGSRERASISSSVASESLSPFGPKNLI